MIPRLRRSLGGHGLIVLFALALSLPLAVGAYASSGRHSAAPNKPSPKASQKTTEATSDDAGENSEGTAPRFHGDGTTACDWPDGVTAPTLNWTHGDYVSAWAKWAAQHQDGASRGNSVRTAARSDCGKPLAAVAAQGHGQSGLAHANAGEQGSTHRP